MRGPGMGDKVSAEEKETIVPANHDSGEVANLTPTWTRRTDAIQDGSGRATRLCV